MKYIKLFDSFLLEELENTNLELKSVFKTLIQQLRSNGLKVKFEYKKMDVSEFGKFIPIKNIYDTYDAYFVLNDAGEVRMFYGKYDTSAMRLLFKPGFDASKWIQNVKNYIDGGSNKLKNGETEDSEIRHKQSLQYTGGLDVKEINSGDQMGLMITPKRTKQK